MKKIILSSVILICSIVVLIAQSSSDLSNSKFDLGVFGGLNIPKLTGGKGNPLSENWSSRSGGAYGVTLMWNAKPRFSLELEALYSGEGGQRNGMQAFAASSFNPLVPAGTYFYATYNNESVLNYLDVPLLAKYSIPLGRTTKFFIDLGPYAGFLLNAKQITSGSSVVYADAAGNQPVSVNPINGQPFPVSFDANTGITNQIRHANFGITGGLGLSQHAGFGSFILNLRGAYGLMNIQKYPEDGKNNNGNLLISLGYSIPICR